MQNCCFANLTVRFFTKIQDQILKNLHYYYFSLLKRKDVSKKKGLYFVHFHRNDPQYRRYPRETIIPLLIVLQVLAQGYCLAK